MMQVTQQSSQVELLVPRPPAVPARAVTRGLAGSLKLLVQASHGLVTPIRACF